jgi:hypothetical protein
MHPFRVSALEALGEGRCSPREARFAEDHLCSVKSGHYVFRYFVD